MTPEKLLSEVVIFNKYSKYLPKKLRRESWRELVYRNKDMHIAKYPHLTVEINHIYETFVMQKKVLPSMRSMQFGGRPIELANNRIYNCAYLPIEHTDAFSESMFLLLGGSGVGYSVQHRHVGQLPSIKATVGERRFMVADCIEGWADAVKVLVEAYAKGKERPLFDLRDIRPEGALLKTSGGKAPGPEPLRKCLQRMEEILIRHVGQQLSPLAAHDMMCMVADAVLAGGIRRAAMICLFDRWDMDMLTCKSGKWWETAPWRGRANNSAILKRGEVTETEFRDLMKIIEASGAGEPGVYWTNNYDWGTNPCCEISLKAYQFCNLTEMNIEGIIDQEDFEDRAGAASFISTLQAGYTDFHYLRPIWKEMTELDALIGVGATGIVSGEWLDWEAAAEVVKFTNDSVADSIGINPAKRCTTVKPAGTSSLVLGCASGIHAWHNTYYIRRMQGQWSDALVQYLLDVNPQMVRQHFEDDNRIVMEFPQKAPEGAVIRTEPMLDLLERVLKLNKEWVSAGHIEGDNKNNVSCTISVKDKEWGILADWMWENREHYNGIAMLPYDGGSYIQAPFEDITEEEYNKMVDALNPINLLEVFEEDNHTNHKAEAACSGAGCEIV